MRRWTWVLTFALLGACGGDGGSDGGTDGGVASDSGPGPVDAGPNDAGPNDAATDAGTTDAGPADAGTNDAGTDAGSTDAGTADAGPADAGTNDAGTDAGTTDAGPADASITDAGPTDAGPDAGPLGCTVSNAMLGIAADTIGAPTVAHHPDGVSLLVWADLERNRVFAILRRDDGTIADLGDLGSYALRTARPFAAPAVVASAEGFAVAWQEVYRDSGGFMQHRFRLRAVRTDGVVGPDTMLTPGLAIHFTDVNARLIDVDGPILVFRGRTGDAVPEARTVINSPRGRFSVPFGRPEQVASNGRRIAIADREGSNLRIRLFAPDGTEETALVVARPVPSENNRLRIEAVTGGWLIVDRNTVYTVSDTGVVGSAHTIARVQSIERGDGEVLLVGIDGRSRAPLAFRVSEAGELRDRLTLDGAIDRVPVDAAAWTGTQWLVTYVAKEGLDDLGMLAAFCDEDL